MARLSPSLQFLGGDMHMCQKQWQNLHLHQTVLRIGPDLNAALCSEVSPLHLVGLTPR